jgi:HK97 family phage prohead protease
MRDRLVVPFEVKALGDDVSRTFEGYGSVFGVLDSYADVVAAGAFKRSLREHKAAGRMPALLWQHDPSSPIGVYEHMSEDETGLFVKGRLSDTQMGREGYTLLKDGALSGLSIGFSVYPNDGAKVDEKTGVRTLKNIKLWETSLVTFPANDAARVTGVKMDGVLPTEREFERWLRREAGFTETEAKLIISKGYRQVRREAMPSEEACGDLLDAIRRFGAIATGEQRHGTAGSQSGA